MIRDSSSIYGEMFKALSDVARRHGLNLILYDKNNDPGIEKRCIRNLIDTMAMGIIVVPVSENINGIRRMTKNTVPVVYLGGNVRPDDVNYVCCDSAVRGQGYPGNRRDGGLAGSRNQARNRCPLSAMMGSTHPSCRWWSSQPLRSRAWRWRRMS